jgi:hypothetical protein
MLYIITNNLQGLDWICSEYHSKGLYLQGLDEQSQKFMTLIA